MVWGFGGENNTASKSWNLNNLLADANDGGRRETSANNVVEFVKAGQAPVAGSQPPGNTDTDAPGVAEAQAADGWTGGLSPLQRLQLNEVSRVKGFVDAGKAATTPATAQGRTDWRPRRVTQLRISMAATRTLTTGTPIRTISPGANTCGTTSLAEVPLLQQGSRMYIMVNQ